MSTGRALDIVRAYIDTRMGDAVIPNYRTSIVSYFKVGDSWRAVVITNMPDTWYYTVTCGIENGEITLDVYQAIDHKTYPKNPAPH